METIFKSSTLKPLKVSLFSRCVTGALKFYAVISVVDFLLSSTVAKSQDRRHTFNNYPLWWKSEFWKRESEGHWLAITLHHLEMGRETSQWCQGLVWQFSGGPVECLSCWRSGLMAKGTGSFLGMTRADIECFLCARHCVKFLIATAFIRYYYKWGNWGPEKLGHLPGLH